ncbi:hypothetical protein [Streptomyces sp. NPDC006879]|uniref:hypothetical protein n=1 Tax=Streptomyces sp. NPDC006879 TaxID=3364767 RepID=UPI00369D18FC
MSDMKRTRFAAVAALVTLAAFTPAVGQAAEGDSGAGNASYVQDPAGGAKKYRSQWTEDGRHKLSANFRLNPNPVWKTMRAKDRSGGFVGEMTVPDPKTLAFKPSYEFGYEVGTAVLLKKGTLAKSGKHSVTLHAELRPKGARSGTRPLLVIHEEYAEGKPTLRKTFTPGRRIACDSGVYRVDWKVSRAPRTRAGKDAATVRGTLDWNADCEGLRSALRQSGGEGSRGA